MPETYLPGIVWFRTNRLNQPKRITTITKPQDSDRCTAFMTPLELAIWTAREMNKALRSHYTADGPCFFATEGKELSRVKL